ncbi:leucine-rich repeat domain-containing protein [bacterium]|nr:leucine-rich repeat domain-containing protein [bacterium]
MRKFLFLFVLALFLSGCDEPEEIIERGFRGQPCYEDDSCIEGFQCTKNLCVDIPVTFQDEVFKKCVEEDYYFRFPNQEINVYNLSIIDRFGCGSIEGENGKEYLRNIDDIKYYKSIRDLSVYSIYPIDTTILSTLTTLEKIGWGGYGLRDLTPIENLVNLKSLTFHNNKISDLTPLIKLKKLNYLWLVRNYIVDVSPIALLPEIEYVNFECNCIQDYSPIQHLIDSENVDIYWMDQFPDFCNGNLTWDEYLNN